MVGGRVGGLVGCWEGGRVGGGFKGGRKMTHASDSKPSLISAAERASSG